MNELKRLETRADVLMRHIEANSKKIRQVKLKKGEWDTRRMEANLRIMQELVDLLQMINELWERQELVA
jgi:hypothetical protein